MKSKKRIAIDMDNVMADVTTQFIEWYYKATGTKVDLTKMVGKEETDGFPDPKLARSFVFEPGFFETLPVMADSQRVVARLNESYEVFIVSAAMEFPNSLIEKYHWMQKHFPFISWRQLVLCGSKAIIKADYMIDDHLKNLDFFDGEKLLFSAPHNLTVTGYNRFDNWKQVEDYFF